MKLGKIGKWVGGEGAEKPTKSGRSYLNSPKQIFFFNEIQWNYRPEGIYRYFNGNIGINFEMSKNIDSLIFLVKKTRNF